MSGSHRAHSARRADRGTRKNGNGLLLTAGGLTGVLLTGVGVVALLALRPDGGSPNQAGPAAVKSDLRPPRSGPPINVTTPEGYSYSLAAVGRGTTAQAVSGATADTSGASRAKLAYADYVLTNTKSDPVLLDFPADLFVRRSKVSAGALAQCTPKPGSTGEMCTPPNQTRIIGYLNGSRPPTVEQGGERSMPPGASYLLRITTNLPVKSDTGREDLGLFVWNVRYTPDRQALEVAFPDEA